jgi:hypothetical protein
MIYRKCLALWMVLSVPLTLTAQTFISGSTAGVWNAAGNPYIVTGDCVIAEDDSLTVEEGVLIEFNGNYLFQVNGLMSCEGAEGSEIQVFADNGGLFVIDGGTARWSYVNASVNESFPEESFLITGDDCLIDFNRVEYWSNSRGLIEISASGLTLTDSDLQFAKDDWFDGNSLISAEMSDVEITGNLIEFSLDPDYNAASGTNIHLPQAGQTLVAGNQITGVVFIESDDDVASLSGLYGGDGSVHLNEFSLTADIPPGITQPEIDLVGIQYFTGVIDSCQIVVDTGEADNVSGSAAALSSCEGTIRRNLILVSGETWAYGISSSEGDIVNNTLEIVGNDPVADSHIAVAYCYGTLKNNIITGVGTAVDGFGNLDHIYNCYWGFDSGVNVPPLEVGEIYADPLFDDDYHLTNLSPCINTGDPDSPFDPDNTRADMGAYYTDQSDRAVITDYYPTDFTSAPEYTEQLFWISVYDPTGTGLNYEWRYRGEVVSADSSVLLQFVNAGIDSLMAFVYNEVGADSQEWVFELSPVNETIAVPGDFPTIQEAIDYASYVGDTIEVSPGTYVETLEVLDKSVSIIGVEGSENTIVDADQGGGVLCIENSGADTVILAGLTLQNGWAEFGGGLYARSVLLDITDLQVLDNHAESSFNAFGGGIYLDDGYARMSDIRVEGNSLYGAEYARGGGIFNDGAMVLQNSTVRNNSAEAENIMATGAGIHHQGGEAVISNCVVSGNLLSCGNFAFGAGLRCTNAEVNYTEITGNLISGAETSKGGGGYATYSEMDHCTVVLNRAEIGAGIYFHLTGSSALTNSIVAFNDGESQIGAFNENLADITYTDVFTLQGELFANCQPGQGSIEGDPLFVGGDPFDVHLTAASPCIDAGDPLSPPDPDGTRTDMGCYYYDALSATDEMPVIIPTKFSVHPAFPNPFNPTTVIGYQLPIASQVTLIVYDISGGKIVELVNGWRDAGTHEVTFDGSGLASGVYLYRLTAGGYQSSGKMVLMK